MHMNSKQLDLYNIYKNSSKNTNSINLKKSFSQHTLSTLNQSKRYLTRRQDFDLKSHFSKIFDPKKDIIFPSKQPLEFNINKSRDRELEILNLERIQNSLKPKNSDIILKLSNLLKRKDKMHSKKRKNLDNTVYKIDQNNNCYLTFINFNKKEKIEKIGKLSQIDFLKNLRESKFEDEIDVENISNHIDDSSDSEKTLKREMVVEEKDELSRIDSKEKYMINLKLNKKHLFKKNKFSVFNKEKSLPLIINNEETKVRNKIFLNTKNIQIINKSKSRDKLSFEHQDMSKIVNVKKISDDFEKRITKVDENRKNLVNELYNKQMNLKKIKLKNLF